MASLPADEVASIKAANATKMRVWRAEKKAAANVVVAARLAAAAEVAAAEAKENPEVAAAKAKAKAKAEADEAKEAEERRRNPVRPRPTAPRGPQPARLTGKENTAAAHIRILEKVKKLTGKSTLDDHELVIRALRKEYPNLNTLSTYLKHIELEVEGDDELFTIYKTAGDAAKVEALNVGFGTSVVGWDELKNLYRKAEGLDKVFLALISLMPPRRTGDYSKLTVGGSGDSNLNYVEDDMIIYQNYKTKKTYGVQHLTMPKKLAAIIKKEMGDRKGNVFGNHMSSVFVRQIGNRAGIPNLNMNTIRHSFITGFLKSNPNNRLRLTMATAMAHSMGMQQSYERRE
jgi:hypothetical protein